MPFATSLRAIAAAALLASALPAIAQAQDPLKSPACTQALEALQAARAAGDRGAAENLRQAAVRTCLGGGPDKRPAPAAQRPLAVPPPVTQVPSAQPLPPAPAPPPPPVAVGRPAMPSHCDAGGCWIDDGTRLRHVPPPFVTPGGACTQMGVTLYCP